MPQTNTTTWLQFALQQMAAESYLDGFALSNTNEVIRRLEFGNNNATSLGLGNPDDSPVLSGNTRFTTIQAQQFTQGYQIINHHASDATGFSATLMKDLTTGQYTLSFRSVEYRNQVDGGDWERDGLPGAAGEIAGTGFALAQLVSMERYYRELKADPNKLPPGAILNVTGYSLGGHLATVFTQLHANEIAATYTFNGAGRGGINGGTSGLSETERIQEMLQFAEEQMLNWDPTGDVFRSGNGGNIYHEQWYEGVWGQTVFQFRPTNSFLPPGQIGSAPGFEKITQLVGQATHNDQPYVANSGIHGRPTTIFIEDQPNVDGLGGLFHQSGSFGTTHSITLLVDSLALMELFQQVDGTLEQTTIEGIFAAASSQTGSGIVGLAGLAEGNSLENALDVLGKIVVPGYTPTSFGRQTNDFGSLTFRNPFYANLEAVRAAVSTQTYQIASFATKSSSEIYAAAHNADPTGLAYRYALQELNPFAVVGADYTPHNPAGPDGGPLDLYDAQTGQGTWTALALIDRAELLAKRLAYNLSDGGAVPTDTHFQDLQTGFEVGSTASTNEVIFGDDRVGDVLSGHAGDDHLYGRDGADTIEGNEGRDYIEGGVGNDPRLSGGAGDDILLGQQGDDQLYGEADNDRLTGGLGDDLLDGGTGLDTYFYRTGQGLDRIVDTDKIGTIFFDNQTLVGGIRRQGAPTDTYTSPDGQFTYVKQGTDLVINGALTIENFDFQTGALGIKLSDAGNLVDSAGPVINYNNGQPTITYDGDATDNTPLFSAPANHEAYGFGGNDVLDFESSSAAFNHQIFGGDGHDELHGGRGQDRIYGEAGRDLMVGVEGDDVLDGGDDIDLLKGGLGQDVLIGGLGNDGLDGGSDNDVIFGGEGNDVLSGESIQLGATTIGNDYLDGEAGDDWVLGLRGDDVLYGSAGADHLYGDQVTSEAPNFELAYPGIVTLFPSPVFTSVTGGDDYLDGGEGDDYLQGDAGDDVLLGGADNDELWGDDQQIGVIEEGDDWLEGEAGNDQLVGGGGEDALFGGEGDDVLVGDYANDATEGFDDTLDSGAGLDQLQGGGGNDLLDGGTENDTLFGDDGDDSLYGGTGNDQLQGGEGDDVLVGEEGADLLFGQAGDDILFGDKGNDQLSGGAGLDDLAGGEGDDVLFGDEDADVLFGDEGNDELQGGEGADQLIGDVGNDRLFGDAGNDMLWGDEGDDQLFGDAGDDILIGGEGNDQLRGGIGLDTYNIGFGSGSDTIIDGIGEGNRVVFDGSITPNDVTVSFALTTLILQFGTGGDQLAIAGFNATNALAPSAIAHYQFADGTMLTHADLVARGAGLASSLLTGGTFNGRVAVGGSANDALGASDLNDILSGGAGDDYLAGLQGDDLILGGAGRDELIGYTGDDVLEGGAGDDYLEGGQFGEGNDTYRYNLGDGLDTVSDGPGFGSEVNELQFGAGITSASISLAVIDSLLTVRVGGGNNAGVQFWETQLSDVLGPHDIQMFSFADSTSLTYEQLVARTPIDVIGTAVDDGFLEGTNLSDRVFGGLGDDVLWGGEGDDHYVFNLGDGIDRIIDTVSETDGNVVQFGSGIHLSMIQLEIGPGFTLPGTSSLILRIGTNGDEIRLASFDVEDVRGSETVRTFQFADGSSLSYAQLLDRGFDYLGSDGDDVLAGTSGIDRFALSGGNDVMEGRAGSDTYAFGRGAGQDVIVDRNGVFDVIQMAADVLPGDILISRNGTDLVFDITGTSDRLTVRDFHLARTFRIEAVRFADGTVWDADFLLTPPRIRVIGGSGDDVLQGTPGDDELVGLGGDDQLTGLGANDILDGGAGADRMTGGGGDDLYLVDEVGDVVIEQANEGVDTVHSAVTYALGDNLENLSLTGSSAINGIGNAQNNILIGNSAANVFTGGMGDDTYVIGVGDAVVESAHEGIDTVRTDGSYTLGANVENLILFGSRTATAIGNALDNVFTGNGAVNFLAGGDGNDTYVVKGLEMVVEVADQGIDTVLSAETIRLGANLENLTLLESDISAIPAQPFAPSVDGFGNELENVLTGNRGNNRLDGGAGEDTLLGGAGDDTYVVDEAGDVVSEVAAAGLDTVVSTVSYVLSDHVEDLTLTGTAASSGIGNALDNWIQGNGADNVLDGGGGNDLLQGGDGSDTYRFGIGSGLDRIRDSSGGDVIELADGVSTGAVHFSAAAVYDNHFFDHMVLRIAGTSDALLFPFFNFAASPSVHFADGTVWDRATILALWSADDSPADGTDWVHLQPQRERLNPLNGTDQLDVLQGTSENDAFFWSFGSDTFIGGAGDDTYELLADGDPEDQILEWPDEGVDTVITTYAPDHYQLPANVEHAVVTYALIQGLTGNALNNVLREDRGNSRIEGGEGDDILIGGFLVGSNDFPTVDISGADILIGGEGDDYLIPVGGVLYHPNGQERIEPIAYLDRVLPNDVLLGGAGNDTYVLYRGGIGSIVEENPGEGIDTIRTTESYVLPADVENLTLFGELSSDVNGTGQELDNVLVGNAAWNRLVGLAGHDTLAGNRGADQLVGGSGDDTYVYNTGDGIDTIEDLSLADEGNRIQFGIGIGLNDLTFTQDPIAGTLRIQIGNSGTDQLVLTSFDPTGTNGSLVVEALAFADGTNASLAALLGLGGPVNHAPTVATPLADQTVPEDAPFSVQVPANTFADQDANDTLTYSASLANGTALPAWLSFNATTRTFTGAPDDAQVGSLDLRVTATDTGTLTVSDTFTLTVTNVNEAPTVVAPLADQQATEDVPFSLVVPATTFADVDPGDILTYSATLADGAGLPSWLSFDSVTRTFSGTPLNSDVGTLNVAVQATDFGSLSVTDTFVLAIQNVNDAPTVLNPIADHTVSEDASFSIQIPANTFADDDAIHGDTLTYSASLADGTALPTWLSFDATTRAFSGTPDDAQVGTLDLRVTATDTGTLSVSDVFTLTVTNVNEAPTVAAPLADQQATEDAAFSFIVPGSTFADVDPGDSLIYSATLADGSALPTWLSFAPITRTFSGTPLNSHVGTLALRVTATDTGTLSASDTFSLTVTNANDAPIVGTPIADQTGNEDEPFSLTIPAGTFADDDAVHGDQLTYSATLADGSPLPTWLSFNPTTRIFSGTPGAGDAGTLQLAIAATDTGALRATDRFTLVVSGPLPKTLVGTVGNDILTGGRGDDTLSGLAGNDTLIGGEGHDLLDGGTGTDTMQGGTGDDRYLVNVSGDVVTELANEGTDTVQSTISYTLGAHVESLTLTGTANLTGTGNELDNILTGNSGNNTLTGGAGDDRLEGGLGHDTMAGGDGNDTYVVDAVGDQVSESSNRGLDTIESSISYTLSGNVEQLTLTGVGTINGTGNSVANVLTGNSANNVLSGANGADTLRGGLGNDTMNGGSGNDTFLFGRGEGQDLVQDNSGAADTILYDAGINPLDLVLSRQANDLRVAIHGSPDQITVQNWYGNTANRIETIQAGNGDTLLNTQVDQLIQAMAGFTAQTGLTWDQAIDQRPQEVQAVLAASWQ